MFETVIGKYCIVRGDRSGVFAGTVANTDGKNVLLKDVRRLWYWDGAASISQIAVDGVKKPGNCKFSVSVSSILLTDAIEIIPATDKAKGSIEAVPVWKC